MLESLTVADFERRVGQRFRIGAEEESAGHDGELVEVTAVGEAAPGGRVPFSLVFRGPPGTVLPQRIYRVDHAELGRLDIFLVPIGADAEGVRYEAVFT